MYVGKESFGIRDFIINILFIALFVFILLWLFPSKSFVENNFEKDGNSQIFNQNMATLKEAAISYFTTPRLPKKVGEMEDLTLKQMRDMKLILPLTDKNGKVCDEGVSYVQMTKENDEYVLKVTLACSDKEEYILVHLGCYDYCKTAVCERQDNGSAWEYQYKLTSNGKWTDWSNWSKWSTTKVTQTSYRKVETKTEISKTSATYKTTYSCAKYPGYTLVGTKCVKNIQSEDKKPATESKTYSCFNYPGYSLVGTSCTKQYTVINTSPAIVTPKYSCASYPGYTLNGTTCTKPVTVIDSKPASEIKTYSCASYPGYILNGTTCTISSTNDDIKPASEIKTYSCANYSGYTLNGTTCTIPVTNNDVKPAEYTCSAYGADYQVSGSSCVKTYSARVTVAKVKTDEICTNKTVLDCTNSCKYVVKTVCEPVYGCPSGSREDSAGKCYKYVTKTTTETANYTCSAYGSDYTLSGSNCIKPITSTDSKPATEIKTYSCANYSGYNLNGTSCIKPVTSTDSKPANEIKTYSCSIYPGYTQDGTTCNKSIYTTDVKPAPYTNIYSCPVGYSLSGTMCIKTTQATDTKPATETKQYSCSIYPGYTLVGNECIKLISSTDDKDASVTKQYVCPKGYTLNGKECSKKVTYYRYSTRKYVGGSTIYKWSTNCNDTVLIEQGYEFTGKTRKIK